MSKKHPLEESIQIHQLENGLTVTLESLPYLHSASIGIWTKAGSCDERDEIAGIAHFLEHLFFKGTKTRTAHQLMEAVEGRGGHINAFTSREYTCLYVKTLAKHVASALEILADLIKNSTFVDLEKERNVILEEIASVEDTPDEHVFDLLSAFHWPDHPLGRSVSGGQQSVEQLGYPQVEAFFREWYHPANMVLSMAGNFDPEAVLEQIKNEFSPLTAAPQNERCSAPTFQAGIEIHQRDIAQAHYCMAFPAPNIENDERYSCDMAGSILGGGSTSRLFEKIREDEGLAYSIYTFQSYYQQAGVLGVYAAVNPGNYPKTVQLTFDEMRRLRDEGLGEEELESNREQIKGHMLMAMENTFTRMSRMAKSMLCHQRIIPVAEVLEHVDAVSAADVQAFLQKTFHPESAALVVLGPKAIQDQVESIAL